jgi:hypothetical protein
MLACTNTSGRPSFRAAAGVETFGSEMTISGRSRPSSVLPKLSAWTSGLVATRPSITRVTSA